MKQPSLARLLLGQIGLENRIFRRSPTAAFFSLIFPLLMLLVFATLFGNDRIGPLGVTAAQFYAPALAVYGAVSTSYWNLSIHMVNSRELGVLKRMRGTPLPTWMFLGGRLASSAWIALLAVLIMMVVGVWLYDVTIYVHTLPAAALTFVVGVACFAALGCLVAALSPNGNATPPIASATLLPLGFISEVFIPPSASAPAWLGTVADFFPLKHFARAFSGAFSPTLHGSGFAWSDAGGTYAILPHLAVMAAWGIGGGLLAVRLFRWEPRPETVG